MSSTTRNLSREAFLWYTLISREYTDQAYGHLKRAYNYMSGDVQRAPLAGDYPPVPHWGGVMSGLLDGYSNARSMLDHGNYSGMNTWCSRLMDVPRGLQEGITSWMGHVNEFWEELDAAYSICSSFTDCIVMTTMYEADGFKTGASDWRVDIPEDMGIASDHIVFREKGVLPTPPAPIPEYAPDKTIACKTGEIVPWTGVWVPSTGMGTAALAFARKGVQVMQPAYEVGRMDEDGDFIEEYALVDCTWYAVRPTGRMISHPASGEVSAHGATDRLRCEANQPCPQDGYWFTPAQVGSRRYFKQGDVMPEVDGDYGATIWQRDESQ